ncbi:unknown [Tannerella sp. CAG:118]|nr:unknown [Tannerella sp. CAG:118]
MKAFGKFILFRYFLNKNTIKSAIKKIAVVLNMNFVIKF